VLNVRHPRGCYDPGMSKLLAVMHPESFAKWIGDQGRPGYCIRIGRVLTQDALVRKLAPGDTLYMVVSRPDDALWLLLVLENPRPDAEGCWFEFNTMPITDISHLRKALAPPKAAPGADAYVSLSEQAAKLLEAVHARFREASKAADAKVRKEMENRAKASALAKKEAKKRAATRKPTRTPTLALLIDGAVAQIEEVASEVQLDPELMLLPPTYAERMGLRGRFTESVQSIFEGGIDLSEATRLLEEELSPFVDGAGLTRVLRELGATSSIPLPKLVDAFAIRAIDDLARTLTALALGRKKAIPSTCAELVPLLADDVGRARALLGEG
jgi:hypothetical protein